VKVLKCCDAGFDCDRVVHAETDQELMAEVAEHVTKDHEIEVTPELVEQIKPLVKEEPIQA
jgi:predicted small metal-binding protein